MPKRWIALGLLLLTTGCESGHAPLVLVRGRVTYRGVSVRHGSVVFTPDPHRGGAGPQSRAEIQPDGTYQLRTDEAAGAVAGWHRITVVAIETLPANPGGGLLVPRSLLPAKYGDPEMSGLGREVVAGRDNQIHLDLE